MFKVDKAGLLRPIIERLRQLNHVKGELSVQRLFVIDTTRGFVPAALVMAAVYAMPGAAPALSLGG